MRSSRVTRFAACGLIGALLVAAGPAGAAPTDQKRARVAVRYLINKQTEEGSICAFSCLGSTADAVVSMVAAKRGAGAIRDAVKYLRTETSSGGLDAEFDPVGSKGKVVLAVVASGRNPRDFGNHNLVREIKRAERPSGRYGETTSVFSDATATLALVAAGVEPSERAVEWLEKAQCADGGWQYDEPSRSTDDRRCLDGSSDDYNTSDTNTTGLAVQALEAAGGTPPVDPFDFFRATRDRAKGGWGYTYGSLTDANSTALAVQAYVAEDRRLPDGAMAALRNLQYRLCGKRAGAFSYSYDNDGGKTGPNVGATIGAIQGLLKRALPVEPFEVTKPAPKPGACG